MRTALLWLVSLLVPVFLILTAVRLLLTPAFVRLEYSLPGFPADNYGMAAADREAYALSALDYLLNNAGIEFLGEQSFPDGAPLYNERELRHMHDVKVLTRQMLSVWSLLVFGFIAADIWARRSGQRPAFWSALGRGGRITLLLIGAVLVFVLLSFDALFVGFHRIFFEGDTWLFQYTDILIRLFPLRFWQDVFIGAGLLTAALAALLAWLGRRAQA